MNKIIQNKKKILITAATFLFALIMIHFDSGKYLLKQQEISPSMLSEAEVSNNAAIGVFSTTAESVPVIISNNSIPQKALEPDEAQEISESDNLGSVKPNIAGATKTSKFYLHQISIVSRLLIKFSQKVDCAQELSNLDYSKAPSDVKQVLDDIQNFTTKYIQSKDKMTQIFPKEGLIDRIVGHFIQIEKLPGSYRNMEEKYEELCKKLYIVEDYFYSQKFLDEARGHD